MSIQKVFVYGDIGGASLSVNAIGEATVTNKILPALFSSLSQYGGARIVGAVVVSDIPVSIVSNSEGSDLPFVVLLLDENGNQFQNNVLIFSAINCFVPLSIPLFANSPDGNVKVSSVQLSGDGKETVVTGSAYTRKISVQLYVEVAE